MKAKRLFTLFTLFASMGIVFGVSSHKEVKKANASDIPVLSVLDGDEYEMDYDSSTHEYYIEDIDFYNGNEIIIKYGDEEYGSSNFNYAESSQSFYEAENNYIGITESSVYCFYFYYDVDDWYIRGTIDPSGEAEQWALDFVENVGCYDTYDTKPLNWDWFAGSFMYLSNGARDLFVSAIASNATTASFVEQAAFIHDMCVAKYDDCDIFMYSDSGSRSAYIPTNAISGVEFNSSALIITIVSVLSFTTLLTLLVFKKSKVRK